MVIACSAFPYTNKILITYLPLRIIKLNSHKSSSTNRVVLIMIINNLLIIIIKKRSKYLHYRSRYRKITMIAIHGENTWKNEKRRAEDFFWRKSEIQIAI